jgi:hypothetical protein
MIHGHKESGYFVTADGEGRKIEGETRQCVHCQFTWEYKPGSGDVRGFCLKCNGFLCGRPECFSEQKTITGMYQLTTGKTRSCISFEEWNEFLRQQLEKQIKAS